MSAVGGPGDPGALPPEGQPGGALRGAFISQHLRGLTKGRLGTTKLLIAFAAALAAIIGIAVAIVALVAPSAVLCKPYQPCGPPKLPQPLVNETLWRSTQFGFTLEYPGDVMHVAQSDGANVTLSVQLRDGSNAAVIIHGQAATAGSASQAVTSELANLNGISQLATDTDSSHEIIGAGVGHRVGVGGAYVATAAAPQGVSEQVGIGAEAATTGNATVVVTVVSSAQGNPPDAGPQSGPWYLADSIANSVKWAGT